jgi:hypothetical protein
MDAMEATTKFLDASETNVKLLEAAEANGWVTDQHLTLDRYIYLEDPETGVCYPNWKCSDITDSNINGLIELKSWGDAVSSLTGGGVTKKAVIEKEKCPDCGKFYVYKVLDRKVNVSCPYCSWQKITPIDKVTWKWSWMVNEGVYHLQNQCIKKEATGLPYKVTIYGNRKVYQKKSGVSSELILTALRKLDRLQGKFRFALAFVENEKEVIATSETFLKDAEAMPRRYVNYNLFKGVEDEPVNALCGFTGIGPEIARRIIEMYSLAEIGYDANTKSKEDFINKYAKNKDTKVPDVGNVTAEKLYVNFKFKGPQPDPVKVEDY